MSRKSVVNYEFVFHILGQGHHHFLVSEKIASDIDKQNEITRPGSEMIFFSSVLCLCIFIVSC